MPGPDLHIHSTASDGTMSPAELVTLAAQLGIPAIALTDHDSVAGVAPALEAARDTALTVIPAVELSAGVGDRTVHILGYYIDHTSPALLSCLAELRSIRLERAERIVYALARDGFRITIADVLGMADGGAVGRAHIAQLLVSAGHVSSVPEAFRTLLGNAAPYYIPKPVSDPETAIGWLSEAGGVAVLAHPALNAIDDLIPRLVDAGIVGIEAYHGAHDEATRVRYARMADELGLVTTGGSDFHGQVRAGQTMGSANVPPEAVADLATAHRNRSAHQ